MNNEQSAPCPEFPFFGASYPDARCIDGYLWDLDKCNENGELYGEGDIPCPFCNTEEFIEYDPFGLLDGILSRLCGIGDPTPDQQRRANELAREYYLTWIERKKRL